MSEREFVKIEGLGTYDDDRLEAVIVGVEKESADVLRLLRDEMAARVEAALERAARVGAQVNAAASKAPRGPKPKTPEEKAADKAAKAAKREAVEMAEPLEFSGRA